MGYQAIFHIYWTRFLVLHVHMQVCLIRGMKRPWRTNYSEDKGGITQTATNHPICSGFLYPWTASRVFFLWNKRVWLRSYSRENANHSVSLSSCHSLTSRSDILGSLPWCLCSQLPGIYLPLYLLLSLPSLSCLCPPSVWKLILAANR